jgi:hypothetical protein
VEVACTRRAAPGFPRRACGDHAAVFAGHQGPARGHGGARAHAAGAARVGRSQCTPAAFEAAAEAAAVVVGAAVPHGYGLQGGVRTSSRSASALRQLSRTVCARYPSRALVRAVRRALVRAVRRAVRRFAARRVCRELPRSEGVRLHPKSAEALSRTFFGNGICGRVGSLIRFENMFSKN